MTLIERLEVEAAASEELDPSNSSIAVMREAAAEITRLKADNLIMHQRLARWTDNA